MVHLNWKYMNENILNFQIWTLYSISDSKVRLNNTEIAEVF